MAFQQGLSGLNIAAKSLDAIGNNIANSQTVGFKTATTQFNDVYAASIGGASGGSAVGQGAGITGVSQNFSQGNITSTNNPLDIAINGNGFLRFQPSLTDQTSLYSRNGQLHLNADGYIVNAQDQFLNAFISDDGETLDQSSAEPLQLSSAQLSPRCTGYANALGLASGGGVKIGLNLDIRDKQADMAATGGVTDAEWSPALTTWNFTAAGGIDPAMYNYSTSVNVIDQRGEDHVMSLYFRRIGVDNGTGEGIGGTGWDVHAVLDGKYEVPMQNSLSGERSDPTGVLPATGMKFLSAGTLDETISSSKWFLDLENAVDSTGTVVPLTSFPNDLFPPTAKFGGATDNYDMTFDFANATMFGSSYDVNKMTQDGYGPGRLSGVAIGSDGQILARYSNGQTKLMGQVTLTTFQNPNGLVPLGGNMWAETAASGQPLLGSPQSGSRGSLQAGAVEDANVDLTAELVNMITLQRAYQANAQSIRTQDEILQTMVNLR